ncbi:MAG: hypothetical protein R6V08_03960 [Desulfuromonadales bacterium]
MKRIVRFLIRGVLFIALLLVIDQAILHVSPDIPVIREIRHFYVDFRGRLLQLGDENPGTSIKSTIETAEPPDEKSQKPAESPAKAPRYIFADENGQLQFADSLDQIPPAYRQSAEVLGD